MQKNKNETYTAFDNGHLIVKGELDEVIVKIKKMIGKSDHCPFLIFSDATGKVFDFNFQGSEKEVLKRLEVYVAKESTKNESGPGRPKLGVVSREVSLLPRHWEWLAVQQSGASGTIRYLIEEAMKKTMGKNSVKQNQEKVYRLMTALAGDLLGYEEAVRFLYKKDEIAFYSYIKDWPKDIRSYIEKSAKDVFCV